MDRPVAVLGDGPDGKRRDEPNRGARPKTRERATEGFARSAVDSREHKVIEVAGIVGTGEPNAVRGIQNGQRNGEEREEANGE
jgi:hypothetical protein